MADIEGIARKLYNIIISPDTVTGLINGGLSVPLDYGYLIYGIFDTDTRYEPEQDRIYRSVVTSIVGRISTNIIASNIAKAVIEKTSFTYVVFKGKGNPIAFLSTILLFGGMAERSIRTSDKLRNEAPEVYSLLRPRDYVLLYFLFADAVQPFVDAIHAGYTEGNPVFDKIMKRVEDHLNTNAKAG
ncbi:hypothetical protein [Klebsiella pneumoniae]|uniref:hypothetical protein n=1 Tax=Klebsiella pneumoniae TaxID=573 RepID=UPI0028F7B405|nr:hypothetical protein [Klebsiella pneumoniae]MDU0042860.1 hypothetical protein [Klebsiella pneumoniae]